MSTRLKANLEEVIQNWVDNNCEEEDWPDSWVYIDLVEDMAAAAYLVFMANNKGQQMKEE